MSTVLAGSGGVSSAMTNSPASLAFLIEAFTPGPLGVMRIPLSPAEMEFSIALIWVCSSPSALPAETVNLTPTFEASASALFCMLTKNGFVVFFRIKATPTVLTGAEVAALDATEVLLLLEQAARAKIAPAAMAAAHLDDRTCATDRVWFCMIWG